MINQRQHGPARKHRAPDAPATGRLVSTVALAVLLALAAALRLWNLGATEFKFDEARVANLAAHFVDTGIPPLRGMGSSTGIDNPPLAVYLIGVPSLLSRDPLVVSAFVALLNVAAVWGCYSFGRRYWGAGVGMLAALLLAASPWAVFYSRKVWAQDLLLPVVLPFIASLYAWIVDGRRWALTGAIVALAALTQIHFAALALVPLLALATLLTVIRRLHLRRAAALWAPLALGISLAVLAYVPYAVADAQNGWNNTRALLQAARSPAQTQWEAVRYAVLNVGGRQIHALTGPERYREFLAGILDLAYWPDRIEEGFVVAGAAYLAYRCWRARKESRELARYGLLLLWLVAPVLFFLRSKTPVFPHYLIPLYPAPYLALAIAARDALRVGDAHPAWKRPVRVLSALTLAALVAWQSYLSLSIHAYVARHDTPGGMGTPLRILRQVVGTMERTATAWDNRQVVMLCPGDNPRWDECPAVFGYMTGRSLDVRFVDGRASLLFPRSGSDTLIVLAPGEMPAAAEIDHYAQPLPDADVSLREAVGAYRFYRLPAGTAPTPDVRPEATPAQLDNGVALLGYALSRPPTPGQITRLSLHWRVEAPPAAPPAQGYSFANHLLAADGRRVGQGDGPGYRVELWRAGDVLVSWFDLDLAEDAPPAPYRLRTGMYVYTPPDRFVTIPVVDAQGRPIADAVEWSLP
jgi:4-amino-4-deoxy-L-arabinose transferase-like glycosyltransferase